jgi:hypothetical protein
MARIACLSSVVDTPDGEARSQLKQHYFELHRRWGGPDFCSSWQAHNLDVQYFHPYKHKRFQDFPPKLLAHMHGAVVHMRLAYRLLATPASTPEFLPLPLRMTYRIVSSQ